MLSAKIAKRLGDDLTGKTIAIWGLAFKPNTDDMRDAPSRVLIADLVKKGARIQAYDPVCIGEARRLFVDDPQISYTSKPMDAFNDADVLAIVTEWKEFRSPNFAEIKSKLKTPAIFDGRNLYDLDTLRKVGIEYYPIGRKQGV